MRNQALKKTPAARVKTSSQTTQQKPARAPATVITPTCIRAFAGAADLREDLARFVPEDRHKSLLHLQIAVGNTEVGRRLTGSGDHANPLRAALPPGPVQRFDSPEHREIGDAAAGGRIVTLGKVGYRISYGEIVALAGDYFKSLAQIEALADDPRGRKALDYARYVKLGPRKTRDDPTGSRERAIDPKRYEAGSYDEATKKLVDDAYFALAADNAVHFVTPRGSEAGVEGPTRFTSAGSTYRASHELALEFAWKAGKAGKRPDAAHAAEAFAGHFLTDAVSAGHVRTPRLDVMEHWRSRDPGLLQRFRAYAINGVTRAAEADHPIITGASGLFGKRPVRTMVIEALDDVLAGKEALLTLGNIVGKALHDYDSERGLPVRVGGQSKRIYGDNNLAKGDTKTVAVAAVRAGVAELDRAYAMGAEGKSFDNVKEDLLSGGAQYEPERLLPSRDPAGEEAMPVWAVDTVDELLADPKMAAAIELALRNLLGEIENATEGMDNDKRGYVTEGLLRPLRADPVGEFRRMLR